MQTKPMSKELRNIDVVVPCFNEEQNVEQFYREMQQLSSRIGEEGDFACEYCLRYIFVDDGSTDRTLDKIKEVSRCAVNDLTGGKYISFSRNFGKEAAMYAGLRESIYPKSSGDHGSAADYTVIMDCDLQHPPQVILDMIARLEETDCDCVAARRVNRKGEPAIRSIFARAFYRIMNRYCDIDIVDGAVDFRIMTRRMAKALADMPETQRFSKGLFAWIGFDTQWVEFENTTRIRGESKWNVWTLTKYAIAGFIDFADSPLKFTGVFGGVVSAGSLIYFIVVILKTLIAGKDTPGYASTICLILFFGGMIIAILSIIGQYIGRMYMETKRRPIYIEKESNTDEENEH